MLPFLRILPVGGVLLAILILVLALAPPGARPLPLAPTMLAARGPLLDRNEHPEWRQVLIQAALRRADELIRLRDLPDGPVRSEPVVSAAPPPVTEPPRAGAAPPAFAQPDKTATAAVDATKVAVLPSERTDADPDHDSITGTIEESPGATIPVEIGEASSFELPVVLPEERPPIIRTPQRSQPAHESRRQRPHRSARAKKQPRPKVQSPKAPPQAQRGLFETLFGGQMYQAASGGGAQMSTASQPAVNRADAQ